MSFKSIAQLKADVKQHAEHLEYEVIKGEVAAKIEKEALEGGFELDYYIPLSGDAEILRKISNELSVLGYRTNVETHHPTYNLLYVNWE